ncbi:reductase [Leptospira ryugenii]|uniref:Reductase n=1 Tax=Leptospira ryugenii TaxID=1917863 RepID=A0A2P2E4V9_9LEPT|nr:NAD(P)H-dependent oxidoreductase [Leptospira ryugenii]GBF51904.1 reductase [Leptospira ryugenii]
MKISLISGSHRKNSQSTKVTSFVQGILEKKHGIKTQTFDLGEKPLPVWEPGMWQKDSEIKQFWKTYSNGLTESDGFIFFSPEYSGMASPALKNFFLFISGADFAHKPGLLFSISSGRGGAYPISELRSSSYKNTRIVYVPDHVIVRNVEKVLNDVNAIDEDDTMIRERIEYSLAVFLEYSKALQTVRSSGTINLQKFGNGM